MPKSNLARKAELRNRMAAIDERLLKGEEDPYEVAKLNKQARRYAEELEQLTAAEVAEARGRFDAASRSLSNKAGKVTYWEACFDDLHQALTKMAQDGGKVDPMEVADIIQAAREGRLHHPDSPQATQPTNTAKDGQGEG